jgi:RNA polymerase sigma-70 factor (ECF subfamily)
MGLEEELSLIKEAQSNVQAFSLLYDMYFPKIYRYCLNRLAHKESAEDVTSQVFLKSIEIIKKFDLDRKLRLGPWLYAIAHNLIIDTIRKNKFSLVLDEKNDEEIVDGTAIIEHELDISMMQKQIASIFSQINPRYAQIISLKYYSELDTDEIALLMDIKGAQVPVVLFRALQSFKDDFSKKYPGGEIIYTLNS